jgi:hypothetical protein
MALKPLTPGYLPLGQFDLLDSSAAVVGGEVGVFATTVSEDYYAADVAASLSAVAHVKADKATAGQVFGLIDEGSAGYGTLYGTIIGGTVGQSTGFSGGAYITSTGSGAIVVGPATHYGSGKATLWAMSGLYGVTADAFATTPSSVNAALYGTNATGKLTTSSTGNGDKAATFVQAVSDSSLVSTTAAAATGASLTAPEFYAVYLLGV